jgi:spore coat polysaccharide biosynthesis protein SpsF
MSSQTAPNTTAIIQARMASSRLPGKVLRTIAGVPMLGHVVRRTQLAGTVTQVLVATTTDPADDPIADFCRQQDITCTRGSQFDVLDRYYQAARQAGAQVVVRITGDCPLIDPQLIDHTVAYFLGRLGQPPPSPDRSFPWDFAANRLPPPWGRTYPIGLDTEVCSFSALECAWRYARQPHQREHVMPYLYEFSPIADSRRLAEYAPPEESLPRDLEQPRFRALLVNHTQDYGHLRWTVDTPADLAMVQALMARLPDPETSTWQQVLEVFQAHPEIAALNAAVTHKRLYDIDARGERD